MLLSSWASACAEPDTIKPMPTVSGLKHRQQVTHRRRDEHLMLLSVGLDLRRAKTVTPLRPTSEQDTGNNATHHRSDEQLVLLSSFASSYVRPKQSSPGWPTAHISLARLPSDASLPSPRHLSLTPSALLCSLACEVPIEGKCP